MKAVRERPWVTMAALGKPVVPINKGSRVNMTHANQTWINLTGSIDEASRTLPSKSFPAVIGNAFTAQRSKYVWVESDRTTDWVLALLLGRREIIGPADKAKVRLGLAQSV